MLLWELVTKEVPQRGYMREALVPQECAPHLRARLELIVYHRRTMKCSESSIILCRYRPGFYVGPGGMELLLAMSVMFFLFP